MRSPGFTSISITVTSAAPPKSGVVIVFTANVMTSEKISTYIIKNQNPTKLVEYLPPQVEGGAKHRKGELNSPTLTRPWGEGNQSITAPPLGGGKHLSFMLQVKQSRGSVC